MSVLSLTLNMRLYTGENGCDWGMKFSSIVGYGKITRIDDKESRIKGLDCIMAHYSDREKFYLR